MTPASSFRSTIRSRMRPLSLLLAGTLAVLGIILLFWPTPPPAPEPLRDATADDPPRISAIVARLGEENRRLRAELDGLPGTPGAVAAAVQSPRIEQEPAIPGRSGLRVRVVRPDGSAVPEVEVSFTRRSTEPPFTVTEQREGVTGEEGEMEFGDLAPGRGTVQVRRPDRARSVEVVIDAGLTAVVTVPVSDGTLVRGRVLRPGAGAFPEMRLCLARRAGGIESYFARTDPHGEYRFEGVPPGRYAVSISGPGYRRPMRISGEERVVTIPDVPEFIHDFYIDVPSLHGRVTDADTGMPVPGVEVLLGQLQLVRAKSGPDGKYEISDLVPGVLTVRFQCSGYAYAAHAVRVSDAPEGTEFDVQLSPEVDVLLDVLDRTGRPFFGKLVVYWGVPIGPSSSRSAGQTVTTDEAGRARLDRLAAGSWRLFFRTESHGTAEVSVKLHRGENLVQVLLE